MPDKGRLHQLIDQLPESEVTAAVRYIQFLLAQEAPVDPEMLTRIDEARANQSSGLLHEDILHEYGL